MGLVVAKLGIVMGMGWILDVLSWGFGKKFPFLFYVGDVFNALQVNSSFSNMIHINET